MWNKFKEGFADGVGFIAAITITVLILHLLS